MRSVIEFLKNKKVIGVIAVGVAVLWYLNGEESAGEITYQTQPLSIGSVESIVNTSGAISPVISVEVGTEVSGLITELMVDFNSEVKKGDVIARIDDQDPLTLVDQREADLISAKASLEQSRANLLKTETQLELDTRDYERQKDIFEKNLISQQDLERAEATYKISKANLEVSKSQVTSSEARLTQAEAQLEQARVNLDKTIIRSPVDGVVIDRAVDIGQTVSASLSAPTLFTIAQNLSEIQIEAAVDEADIGRISEGMDVRFRVDAFSDRVFEGSVAQVRKASTVTSNVVTYKVIIRANNPGQILFPGMTANIDIVLGRQDDVLRGPNTALRFKPSEGTYVEETSAQAGAFGENRETNILDQLELSNEVRKSVEQVLEDSANQMRELFENQNPNDFFNNTRQQSTQIRERTNNSLRSILTPTQFEKYMAASQPAGSGRAAGGNPAAGQQRMTRGEVWVLENGMPSRRSIQVGLSDDQYSQIQSPQLNEGDQVIVRAIRSFE